MRNSAAGGPVTLDEQTNCSVCCCTMLNKIQMLVFMILLMFGILFGNSLTLAVVLGTND